MLLQRVIACSVSDQSGGCQNCKASFKWLPGNVHSYTRCIKGAGLGPKHYQRDQWNVMMSLADLDVSKTSGGGFVVLSSDDIVKSLVFKPVLSQ